MPHCLLREGHPGHNHIRSLEFVNNKHSYGWGRYTLLDLLHVLPINQLQTFRCSLVGGIEFQILETLFSRQTKLHTLALGPFNKQECDGPPFRAVACPAGVKILTLDASARTELEGEFYNKIIARRELRSLTVRICEVNEFGARRSHEKYLPITCRLFNHILVDGQPRHELQDLTLQNQWLGKIDRTWVRFIDFSRLETLQLINCEYTTHLVRHLLKLAKEGRIHLRGLVLSNPGENVGIDYYKAVQELLASTTGLEYFGFCHLAGTPEDSFGGWEDYEDFDIRCLRSHSHSLKHPLIGIGSNDADADFASEPLRVRSMQDFEWLTKNCINLKQLAIAWPQIFIEDVLGGDRGKFKNILAMLVSLPKLKVLRILDCPGIYEIDTFWERHAPFHHVDYSRAAPYDVREAYLRTLDKIAAFIASGFQRARRPATHQRLSVLTFGHVEEHHHVRTRGNSFPIIDGHPITYRVRRERIMRRIVTRVERLDAFSMRYEEPMGFVLNDEDMDQGLSLEPCSSP